MCVCSCRLDDSVTLPMLADGIDLVCPKIPIKPIDFSYKLQNLPKMPASPRQVIPQSCLLVARILAACQKRLIS
jgi:hypothetical protein